MRCVFCFSRAGIDADSGECYYPIMEHRQRVYRTHGIILKRRISGDADRILTVFTPSYGKLELIAKGVRKTTSRKAGHLESFSHASLLIAQARTWDIITEAETVENFRHLREDLDAFGRVAYVGELLDSFTEINDQNQPLWEIFLAVIRELNRSALEPASIDANVLLRWYELHLLGLTGFQPQLFTCLASGHDLAEETNYLSISEGGLYSPNFAADRPQLEPIEPDVLKILRHLQRNPWPNLATLRVSEPVIRRAENILHRMLVATLEHRLKSVDFLRKLRHI